MDIDKKLAELRGIKSTEYRQPTSEDIAEISRVAGDIANMQLALENLRRQLNMQDYSGARFFLRQAVPNLKTAWLTLAKIQTSWDDDVFVSGSRLGIVRMWLWGKE